MKVHKHVLFRMPRTVLFKIFYTSSARIVNLVNISFELVVMFNIVANCDVHLSAFHLPTIHLF